MHFTVIWVTDKANTAAVKTIQASEKKFLRDASSEMKLSAKGSWQRVLDDRQICEDMQQLDN